MKNNTTIKQTARKIVNFFRMKRIFEKIKSEPNKPADQVKEDKKIHIPERKVTHRPPLFESQLLKRLREKRKIKNRIQKRSRLINKYK